MKVTLSPRQVAHAIGVSEASVKRWCDRGLLEATRTAGGHRRLSVATVIQFLRDGNHPLVRPEVLGLPATVGTGPVALQRATEQIRVALEAGDEEQFRAAVFGLYLNTHSVVDICDNAITPVMHALGTRWGHGEIEIYQERFACEICVRVLYDLRALLPPIGQDAPLAIGGTVTGDPYVLPTTMVDVVLREAGWQAESHGVGHPIETLCAAARHKRPRLVWVSASTAEAVPALLEGWPMLQACAREHGAVVVIGGRALNGEIHRQMSDVTLCDNLHHLVKTVSAMVAPSEGPHRDG